MNKPTTMASVALLAAGLSLGTVTTVASAQQSQQNQNQAQQQQNQQQRNQDQTHQDQELNRYQQRGYENWQQRPNTPALKHPQSEANRQRGGFPQGQYLQNPQQGQNQMQQDQQRRQPDAQPQANQQQTRQRDGAQADNRPANQGHDLARRTWIIGTVEQIQMTDHNGEQHTHLRINTQEAGAVTVDLGPARNVGALREQLNEGNEVTVLGLRDRSNNQGLSLVASKLLTDNHQFNVNHDWADNAAMQAGYQVNDNNRQPNQQPQDRQQRQQRQQQNQAQQNQQRDQDRFDAGNDNN